jgi:hypothetical protein
VEACSRDKEAVWRRKAAPSLCDGDGKERKEYSEGHFCGVMNLSLIKPRRKRLL